MPPAAGTSHGDIDYNILLMVGPMCVVKPLQMVKNVAMRPVFKQPKRTHVSWCWWSSNGWCIMIYSRKLTYREPAGSAPSYVNSVVAVGLLFLLKALENTALLRAANRTHLSPPLSSRLLSPSLLFTSLFSPCPQLSFGSGFIDSYCKLL